MSNSHMELEALAVLRSLYDNDKNVYNVLWEFAKHTIIKHELSSFTASEMKAYFAKDYGFGDIPLSVIKTMLRKHKTKELKIKNEDVYVMPALKQALMKSQEMIEIVEQKNHFLPLLNDLSVFIAAEQGEKPSMESLMDELRRYLLEDVTSGKYTNAFNQFILQREQEQDDAFREVLNQIKEGFILYSGICWCAELNELGKWRYPLTLYFDMDIIFYLAGYSGSIYQTIVEELYKMIQDVNGVAARKKQNRWISIRYFAEEKERIDHYFKIAEAIVRGDRDLDASEPAMLYIVSHCDTPSKVVEMRARLDALLASKAILEDNRSFYERQEDWIYNVESIPLIEQYAKRESKEKVERYLKRINYIAYLRKGQESTDFSNCRYLMVTRNHLAAQLDRDAETTIVRKQYSRVISPETLTSQFWFQMNKGFSENPTLISVDVLAQAKIIMARQVNVNIAECHRKIKQSYENGEITQEQAVYQCALFRQYCVTPDDVTREIEAEVSTLTESSVQEMIRQQGELRIRHQQIQDENASLKSTLTQVRQSMQDEIARAQAEQAAGEEKDRLLSTRDAEIEEKNRRIAQLEERERKQKEQSRKRKKYIVYAIFAAFLVATVLGYGYGMYSDNIYARTVGEVCTVMDAVFGVISAVVHFKRAE